MVTPLERKPSSARPVASCSHNVHGQRLRTHQSSCSGSTLVGERVPSCNLALEGRNQCLGLSPRAARSRRCCWARGAPRAGLVATIRWFPLGSLWGKAPLPYRRCLRPRPLQRLPASTTPNAWLRRPRDLPLLGASLLPPWESDHTTRPA